MKRARRLTLAGILLLALAGCGWFNERPQAEFSRSPLSGDAPLSVFFDASASQDADGVIVAYQWSFGDGGAASGITATHTFVEPGTYQVRLSIVDDAEGRDEVMRMVTVTNPATPLDSGPRVGMLAPDFALEDLDGDPVSLHEFRGYVLLLDFWASTCSSCRLTMGHLDDLAKRFGDRGLVVVGISLDASAAAVEQFLEQNQYDRFITLHQSLAAATQIKTLYEVDAIPRTFVIDRQGIIRHIDHPIRLRDRDIEPWL